MVHQMERLLPILELRDHSVNKVTILFYFMLFIIIIIYFYILCYLLLYFMIIFYYYLRGNRSVKEPSTS